MSVWFYVRANRQRELRQARTEQQLAMARLDALCRQLQPHFLFNALNMISTLIEEEPRRAEDTLNRLAAFLRVTLRDEHRHEVPLRAEP